MAFLIEREFRLQRNLSRGPSLTLLFCFLVLKTRCMTSVSTRVSPSLPRLSADGGGPLGRVACDTRPKLGSFFECG